MRDIGHDHGRYNGKTRRSEEKRLVKSEDLEGFEKASLERIKAAADDGTLLKTANLDLVLHHWQQIESTEATRDWVSRQIASRENLIRVLRAFRREISSHTDGNVLTDKLRSFDTNYMKTFIDVDQLAERAKEELEKEDGNDEEHELLSLYLKFHQRMKSGKSTDSMSFRDDEDD